MKDWCLTIVDFMIGKDGAHFSFTSFKDIINDTYNIQNLRGLQGMRCVYSDTNEWARDLLPLEKTELNKILYDKFGEDLSTCSGRDVQKIKRIVRKGKIATENEYRLVQSRVDEIYADTTKKEEIETLNMLLSKFALSKGM